MIGISNLDAALLCTGNRKTLYALHAGGLVKDSGSPTQAWGGSSGIFKLEGLRRSSL